MSPFRICLAVLLLGSAALAEPTTNPAPVIEVCFVLDTTGSMTGLIEGAKQKIWSIANDIITTTPRPRVRIALVPYRDRGDLYITKVFDLTDDIDKVFADLKTFTADGGGDEPESVNEALDVAVHKVAWTRGDDVLKMIFLVGDAPPHMDYANDVKYPETCKQAATLGVIINTVQCGKIAATTPIWKEIAQSAEGRFVKIGQTGDMTVAETPMDKELAATNTALNATVCLYGVAATQPAAQLFMHNASSADAADPAAAGGRIAYKSKALASAAHRESFGLGGVAAAPAAAADIALSGDDLVAAVADKRIVLKDVKTDQLPAELQKMTPEQREQYIADRTKQRAELRAKLDKLTADRDAWLADQRAMHAAAIAAGSEKAEPFDEEVMKIIREETARKQQQKR